MVTDNQYNCLFLVSTDGVIVVDAPPSIGQNIAYAIGNITNKHVTHFIYSHAHSDHVGGSFLFENATRIAHNITSALLAAVPSPNTPIPDIIFGDKYTLSYGNQTLQLSYKGPNHQPGNIFIYTPKQKVLMLVDVIFPGSGSHKRTLEGHIEWVSCVAFSPDGKTLASSLTNKTVQLWDVAGGNCQQTIREYSSGVGSVAFSRDGRILASVPEGAPVRLWDMAHGKHLQTLEAGGQVSSVAFSPDGGTLAVSLADDGVQLWDTAFSLDGKMLAFTVCHVIMLWDIATGSIRDKLEKHSDRVSDIVFSPDGMTLASGSPDCTIRLWDVSPENSQRRAEDLNGRHHAAYTAFSPDGETLVWASQNDFQVWDTATWSCQRTIPQRFMEYPWDRVVFFSPNGRTLAVASDDEVQLWNTTTWTCQLTQKGAQPFCRQRGPVVAFSPDSKTLATTSQEKTIQCWLWDAATGSTLWTSGVDKERSDDDEEVKFVAFLPEGKTLASISRQGGIELWNAATGSRQQSLRIEGDYVPYPLLAFSPNGKTLASALQEGDIKLWQETTGHWSCTQTIDGGNEYYSRRALASRLTAKIFW